MRLTPGQRVTPEVWFATYVNQALSRGVLANTIAHLKDYGASLLGSRPAAVEIVDEWLASDGG